MRKTSSFPMILHIKVEVGLVPVPVPDLGAAQVVELVEVLAVGVGGMLVVD